MEKTQRASKKQRELLQFIDAFIKGYGYGPSYREIMRALGYKSVSTVAVHVDGLIAGGYMRKKDNSARSLEVVTATTAKSEDAIHKKWLTKKVAALVESGVPSADRSALERTVELLTKD